MSCTTYTQTNHRAEIHCKHFFGGYPFGAPETNDLIIRDIYAMSNNDETKLADWLAYRISIHEVDGYLDVERKWRSDPWLDENETLEKGDYKDANKHPELQADRGHQAPLAAFKNCPDASQSNYLSNITPQNKNLNQGVWKRLEEKVREIVREGKVAYVMTGPLYEFDMPKLPQADESHQVPSGYWKIIIIPSKGDSFEHAAFVFNQDTPRDSKLSNHVVTIDTIEEKSHLDFFWELDKTVEINLESDDNKSWVVETFR